MVVAAAFPAPSKPCDTYRMLKVTIHAVPSSLEDIVARIRSALAPVAREAEKIGGKIVVPPSAFVRGAALKSWPPSPEEVAAKGQFYLERTRDSLLVCWHRIPEFRSLVSAALSGVPHHLQEPPEQQNLESLYRSAKEMPRDTQGRKDIIKALRGAGYEELAQDLEEPESADGSSAKPLGRV